MISSLYRTAAHTVTRRWQAEVMLLALAGMETCWFTPLFLAASHRSWTYAPYSVALVLWLTMWGMMRSSLFLAEKQIGSPSYQLTVVGAVILSSLVALRLYLHAGSPWNDWTWLASTGRALANLDRNLSDEIVVLAAILFLWWRAVALGQHELHFYRIGYEFRRSVLLLASSMVLLSYVIAVEVNAFIAPFFFFSLLALALARVRDKSKVSGGIERPFGPSWLLVLGLVGLIVLGAGWLLSSVYSLESFSTLLGWGRPVFERVGQAIVWMMVQTARLLSPLMLLIVSLIRRSLGPSRLQGLDPAVLDGFFTDAQEVAEAPAWAAFMGRYICPTAVIAFILLALVLRLRHRERWDRRLVGDEPEMLGLRSGVADSWRDRWQQLRALLGQVRRLGVGRQMYAAISVRYIYANVIRLAARRGVVRPAAQTPSEFLPTLVDTFPGHGADLSVLTEAYVRVHYGELPYDRAELDELRACWNRLRGRMPASEHTEHQHSAEEGLNQT